MTRGVRIATARLVFITHGQASDEFWKVVQRGKDDAHKQTGAAVSYRSPDAFSIERMRRYIDEAVADHPDGLIVSLPDAKALAPSIKAAVKAGIPVITINSGSDEFRKLGVLAHVGQDEYEAGLEAGRRMGRAGVKRALCVNQENGNTGLDQRCRGPRRRPGQDRRHDEAAARSRCRTRTSRRRRWPRRSRPRPSTASSRSARAAPSRRSTRSAQPASQSRVKLATFDLSPDVLAAVRDGKMLFAVDQQPYLQGYLPVMLLAERARYGVFPGEGELIPTGPKFITKADAAEVIRLERRGDQMSAQP